ncbi:DUF6804 family protein [Virgibacillus sp. DJP39]|uniref:DUF6804 family protein n=1 Tax=Virgibacillus sp. DJP39 TaxID=3409790 RepID=UPI003BB588B3
MIARILLIIVIFFGILNQPYSYYEFLRIFVFIISVILTINSFQKVNKSGFEYLYLGLAILFNPIIPIYASKEIWVIFDVVSIILIGTSLSIDKAEKDSN